MGLSQEHTHTHGEICMHFVQVLLILHTHTHTHMPHTHTHATYTVHTLAHTYAHTHTHTVLSRDEEAMGRYLMTWSETEYTNAGEVMQNVGKMQESDSQAR